MDTEQKVGLLRVLVENVTEDFNEEDILHMILEKKIAANPEENPVKKQTVGQKTADKIAKFAGSWTFIFSFTAVLLLWMLGNHFLKASAFDPYPFILLNLVLSCVAAVQAPLIMMSQNRREEKDRVRSENDYKINLKAEFIIEDLHKKMDRILENQERLLQCMESLEEKEKRV